MSLDQQSCVPCRGGVPTVPAEAQASLLQELPDWHIGAVDGIERLEKVYRFKNFQQAMAFSLQVGELAEAENHHPALLTEWGRVTVSWWTHKIGGLHQNDFVMAAKTDKAYTQGSSTTSTGTLA